ncbi:MAG: methyltransferase domain-containing protein [Chloroflexi bacterium]|nr:methyltransferase domain-containing protein [Chloroflexota bacterium]
MALHASPVNALTCPVCGEKLTGGTQPRVYTCPTCGLGYTWPPPPLPDRAFRSPAHPPGPLRLLWWKGKRALLQPLGTWAGLAWRILPPPSEGARALDLGCGDGAYVQALEGLGWRAVGVDLVPPPHPALIPADAQALPFATGVFHLVTLWHVLEHVPDPRRVLAESSRVLSPSGLLCLEVPHPHSWQAHLWGTRWLHWDPSRHRWHFSPQTLTTLLQETGFHVQWVHTWPNAPGWVDSGPVPRSLRPIFWLVDGLAALVGRGGVLRACARKKDD